MTPSPNYSAAPGLGLLPLQHQRYGAAAIQARDLLLDSLDVLSRTRALRGSPLALVLDQILESWTRDRGDYLFGLDFTGGDSPVLIRTCGPWSLLRQATLTSSEMRQGLSRYIGRRVGARGMVSVRTGDYPAREAATAALLRAVVDAERDAQHASLGADWDDAPDLAGALIAESYLQYLIGDHALPPEDVALVFPLWSVLLDDPSMLVLLSDLYPQHALIAPARLDGAAGRCLGDQVGYPLVGAPRVTQEHFEPDAPIDLVRIYVTGDGVAEAFDLVGGSLRCAQSGTLSRLTARM